MLSDAADFIYRCTEFWAPPYERAIQWNDPDLEIAWALPAGVEPIISAKDARATRFKDAEYFP